MTPIEQCAVALYLKFGTDVFHYADFNNTRNRLGHNGGYDDIRFLGAFCRPVELSKLDLTTEWEIDPEKINPLLERITNE